MILPVKLNQQDTKHMEIKSSKVIIDTNAWISFMIDKRCIQSDPIFQMKL